MINTHTALPRANRRLIATAIGAALLAALCNGCSSTNSNVPQKTAHVTVDENSRTSHAVTCSQVNWLLTAKISAAPANITVLLRLDPEKPKVESVHFDNFVGFSGVANAGAGEARVRVAKDSYSITGTAAGSRVGDPKVSVTAPFTIEVGC